MARAERRGAVQAYRRKAQRGDPEAMFHLGSLLAEDLDPEGLVWLRRAVQAAPDDTAVRNNLGHALRQEGNLEEAGAVFEALVAVEPGRAAFHYGLATVQVKQGRLAQAASSLARSTSLHPTFVEALRQHGEVLEALGRPTEAMEVWTRALALQPKHPGTLRKVGLLHAFFGRKPVAVAMLRQCLAESPSDAMAAHMLGALTGEGSSTPDDAYVRELFDAFADSFDSHLQQVLGYRVPTLLGALVRPYGPFARVLDLGCGTGLMAPELDATLLEGVDLSPGMVDKARARGGYDRLVVRSIDDHLRTAEGFDLIVAADVFVYVGALDTVFAGVRRACADDGLFAFTTELHDGEGVLLRPNGRFAHSAAEVDRLCVAHGFRCLTQRREVLRQDAGTDVIGQLVLLQTTR
jgi:predicted TPR repeat methyltransferase